MTKRITNHPKQSQTMTIAECFFALLLVKPAAAALVVLGNHELLGAVSKTDRPDWLPILSMVALSATSVSLVRSPMAGGRVFAWLFAVGAGFFADVPLRAAGYEIFRYELVFVAFVYAMAYRAMMPRLRRRATRWAAVGAIAAITVPWGRWDTTSSSWPAIQAVCYSSIAALCAWSLFKFKRRTT